MASLQNLESWFIFSPLWRAITTESWLSGKTFWSKATLSILELESWGWRERRQRALALRLLLLLRWRRLGKREVDHGAVLSAATLTVVSQQPASKQGQGNCIKYFPTSCLQAKTFAFSFLFSSPRIPLTVMWELRNKWVPTFVRGKSFLWSC